MVSDTIYACKSLPIAFRCRFQQMGSDDRERKAVVLQSIPVCRDLLSLATFLFGFCA